MAIEQAVAEAAAGHQPVEALVVGALRQPDAEGPLPQQPLVLPYGRHQLGMHRLRCVAQEGQVAVGGGTADQIKHAGLLKGPETGQQVAAAGAELVGCGLKLAREIGGGSSEVGICFGQQLAALLKPGQETPVQLGVAQQRQQRGGEPESEPGLRGRVGGGVLQHLHQGQVALLQGLEVPVFLKGAGLPGADVGKMGVENQGQIAGGHGSSAEK